MDKPGYKTSELWLAVTTAIIGVLIAYGILSHDEAEAWGQLAAAIIPLALAIVSASYSRARSEVKKKQ